MPRIQGIRERLYGNIFDAIPLLEMQNSNLLFSRRNIGNMARTNMYDAEQLPDRTMVVANVYTRSNVRGPRPQLDETTHAEVQKLFADGHSGDAIGTLMRKLEHERTPLVRALEEWAHVARVQLEVGYKLMLDMPFIDLMDGPALGPAYVPLVKRKDQLEGLEPELLPWRKQLGRCFIIPERQGFRVRVNAPEAPTRALRHLATEAGILPEPLAWVHLEGLTTRDIY